MSTIIAADSKETLHRQDVVPPKLPVPPLTQTLERYLHAVRAIVPRDRYEITEKIVSKFGEPNGEGHLIQKKLIELAAKKENWIYEWWLDDMYFKVRIPLPINVNPGMVFPNQTFKGMKDLIRMVAHFVHGVMDYKTQLDRGEIAQEYLPAKTKGPHSGKPQPLCMDQYDRLLNTCRIPGPDKDYHISKRDENPNGNEHILVLYKRKFFVIDVILDKKRVSKECIEQALDNIILSVQNDTGNGNGDYIGILTADQRDRWANARARLLEDKTNKESLWWVEKSLFVICIDDPLPLAFNKRRGSGASRKVRDDVNKGTQMLYGGGSKNNSANRWFDQTLQLIFTTDGVCGLCYQHSPAEGVVVIQLVEKLLYTYGNKDDTENQPKHEMTSAVPQIRKLVWNITNDLMESISSASQTIDKLGQDLDFYVLRFTEYGSDFAKTNKMSPDAYIQLALQLTYYKVHNKLVHTYESASTRRFRMGRVDNIRAATPEALKWVRSVCGDPEADDAEKMAFFREALTKQTEIMTYNILGHGIDCHLLGLREMAVEIRKPTPELFTDETYTNSQLFLLSTSQVQTKTDSFMGYGAVVPNGYGASYNPHSDNIVFCISSFYSDDDTGSELFAMSLESTLLQMKEMIEKADQPELQQRRRNSDFDSNRVQQSPKTKHRDPTSKRRNTMANN